MVKDEMLTGDSGEICGRQDLYAVWSCVAGLEGGMGGMGEGRKEGGSTWSGVIRICLAEGRQVLVLVEMKVIKN